ncbi:MAG: translation initiation factor IF-3, partial [Pseudomonadales bacterium]|nr:translation initiation factor IF-3 [Pseudomonadales bacterium]
MKSENKKLAVNEDIRARQVRLIDQEGTQLGIVPIEEALKTAETAGL